MREYLGLRARVRSMLQKALYEPKSNVLPPQVTMGRHSYWWYPEVIAYSAGASDRVEIGAFCSIAEGVRMMLTPEHRADYITTHNMSELKAGGPLGGGQSKGPIVVGHDVWIGYGAVVLSGVTIGTGAVIGAFSVVASDVRPYAIVVGNPAREIRRRFSDDHVDALLATRWWEWPDERLREALPSLWSSDVAAFLDAANERPDSAEEPRSTLRGVESAPGSNQAERS